jgi:hypothetical protein
MNPQTTSQGLMGRDAVPRTNTEAGRRILKDAPAGGPVFKTFADFLGAVALRKIGPIDLRRAAPDSVSAPYAPPTPTSEYSAASAAARTAGDRSPRAPRVGA